MDGMIEPAEAIDIAFKVQVMLSLVDKAHVTPLAVPLCTMSEVVKLDDPTAPENTMVNDAGRAFVGSFCPAA